MKRLVPITFISAMLAACSSIECPLNNVVEAVYTLQKSTGLPDTLYDTLTIFTRRSDGTDTILLNKAVQTTSFELPMSHTNETDELYFLIGSITDKVTVTKTNTPHFESVDCTPSYFHQITDVQWQGSLIDNIIIKNQEVSYDTTTNMYIVFKKSY